MFRGGFPFPGGFAGGFPGGAGMGGGPDSDDEDVNTTAYYETLGVEKTATPTEIKKAYHRKAKEAHPDKGGDPEAFKEITKAYTVLSDPEKRELYDERGEKGVERGPEPDADDMMRMFFGGGAPRRRGPRKADPTVLPLRLTLEQLYTGVSQTVPATTTKLEADPAGNVMDRSGNRYKRTTNTKPLEVHVDKGAKHGHKIVKHGEGDIMPNQTQGDVVFVVQERDHPVFTRKGCDLVMKKEVSLLQALTGVEFVVEHLDGHRVIVSSAPGQVIQPDSVMQIKDEGMPVFGNTFVFGCLFVQFDVKFPKTLELTDAMKRVFAGTLPGGEEPDEPIEAGEEDHVGVLEEMDMEARRDRERLAREAEESDDEGGPGGMGGQTVQCAHQ